MRAISVLALSVACWLVAAPAPAQTNSSNSRPLALSAESVLLLDTQGRVLYAKKPAEDHAPASLVKLMTLYLACEALEAGRAQWDEPVLGEPPRGASRRAIAWGSRRGESVPLRTLLEGVAIASANDAATAVAEHLGGTEEAFVAAMNAKAEELGLTHTHFANAHGLPDPAQRSTAAGPGPADRQRLLEDYPASRPLLGGATLRLPRARLQPPHPALPGSGRRPGAQDRLHARGGLQPGHLRLEGRAALRADRARLADPQPLVPRREDRAPLRLLRDRPRGRAAGAGPARSSASPAVAPRRPGDRRPRAALPGAG